MVFLPLYETNVPLNEASARSLEQEEPDTGIVRSIRNFPLENSTPIDCMMFVASLKKCWRSNGLWQDMMNWMLPVFDMNSEIDMDYEVFS